MGCDIHIVLEKKFEETGKWVGVLDSTYTDLKISERNYQFFAEVASVRGRTDTSLYPKFLPIDISELAYNLVSIYGTDGHSHSHLSAHDFVQAYVRAYNNNDFFDQEKKPFRDEYPICDLLKIFDGDADSYRVVFWFDN